MAIIGFRGRDSALASGFARLQGASVEYLVDVDDRAIAPAADAVEKAGGKRPKTFRDMRRVRNDGAHQIDMARWALGVELPAEASGTGAKLWFNDDQQTPDTMNVTFAYPGRQLMFEMRIWNPYGMKGAENGVAVYGGGGMVQIARWNRLWGYKVFDEKGKLVTHEQTKGEDEGHVRNFLDCVR